MRSLLVVLTPPIAAFFSPSNREKDGWRQHEDGNWYYNGRPCLWDGACLAPAGEPIESETQGETLKPIPRVPVRDDEKAAPCLG